VQAKDIHAYKKKVNLRKNVNSFLKIKGRHLNHELPNAVYLDTDLCAHEMTIQKVYSVLET
jgi:hypothetical protein